MEKHRSNKEKLEEQIQESRRQLHDLQRKNQMTTAVESSSKKAGEEESFNVNELLKSISEEIVKVYKHSVNPNADLHARETIDILTVSAHSPPRKLKFNLTNI